MMLLVCISEHAFDFFHLDMHLTRVQLEKIQLIILAGWLDVVMARILSLYFKYNEMCHIARAVPRFMAHAASILNTSSSPVRNIYFSEV